MTKPDNIRKAGQAGKINMLVYGEPGVGKSVFAGTSPKALVLCNNVDETVSMLDSTAEMWEVTEMSDLQEAYDYLRHGGIKDYDWVWFDNATLWQDQNMDAIMTDVVAQKSHREFYVPDKQEYLKNQNQLGFFIRNMTALDINFGVIAHAMSTYEENVDDEVLMPMFQGGRGALSQKICGYMNIVMYMNAKAVKGGGTQRFGYTAKARKHYAKDRFRALPGRMVDPTVPQITELINKGRKPVPAKKPATRRRKKVNG